MSTFKTICALLKTNLLKTLWFNWKMLPWQQARHLPIWLYGKFTFRSTSGTVSIDGPVQPGMIKIGKRDYYVTTSIPQCIWTIRGSIRFRGQLNFGFGSYVMVSDGAELSFGSKGSYFGTGVKIICFKRIEFGDAVHVPWECQFIDTSFHYIENQKTGEVPPLTRPIRIGTHVWIGNRTTVTKGAVIPDNTIVASNSLVNKDFSTVEPYCLLAGVPASVKARNLSRIEDARRQRELDARDGYVRTYL